MGNLSIKQGKNNGRGSVTRSIRRRFRWENEKGYKEKVQKITKKSQLKRKKRINKRCPDCNKLIFPHAIRCKRCHLISLHNNKYKHLNS